MRFEIIIKLIFTCSIALNLLFFSLMLYKVLNRNFQNNLEELTLTSYWKDKVAQFEILNAKNHHKICFVGDSFFDRFILTEFFCEYDVYNRSIGGESTKTLLTRFDNTVLSGNPDVIFLYIGGNDISHGVSENDIENRIKAIIDKTLRNNIKLSIISIFPRGINYEPKKGNVSELNSRIVFLNKSIKKICKLNYVGYLDFYSKFTNKKGFLRQELSNDGIHLNGKGYVIFAEEIKMVLTQSQNI